VDCSFCHTCRLAHQSCQRLKWTQDWGQAGVQHWPGNVSDLVCIQTPAADSAKVTLNHFTALLRAWTQREKDIFEQWWTWSRSYLYFGGLLYNTTWLQQWHSALDGKVFLSLSLSLSLSLMKKRITVGGDEKNMSMHFKYLKKSACYYQYQNLPCNCVRKTLEYLSNVVRQESCNTCIQNNTELLCNSDTIAGLVKSMLVKSL
jgi:hypothetical protein